MALTQISTQGIKDGTITGTDLATNVDLVDDQKLRLGNSNDLQIYHDGSNSYIQDTDQGNLFIEASAVLIRKNGTTENIAKFIQDGAVELYYDNSKKFETTSDGVSIPTDSTFLRIGAGQDLDLHHNGTNSYIRNKTGDLHIRPLVAEEGIILKPNGAVELYHDNAKKFETTSTGANVTSANDAVLKVTTTGTASTDDARIELITQESSFIIQNDRSLGTSGALTFAGNSSNYLVIDHNGGNIGIGTASPAYTNALFGGSQRTFHLIGTAAPQLRIQSSTSGQADLLLQAGNSGSTAYIANAASGGDLFFSTNNGGSQGTRFAIKDDGKVGIGTTSPGAPLTIDTGGTADALRIGNSAGTDTFIRLGSTGTNTDTHAVIKYDKDDNYLSMVVAGESHGGGGILIANGGNVGIGTTSPQNMIHTSSANDSSGIRMTNTYDTPDNVWALLPSISGVSNTGFTIRDVTDGRNCLVIDGSGNVFLDNTFSTTANNARKSYFTVNGQQIHGRNAHEAYIVFQDTSNNNIGNITRGAGSSIAFNTTSDYRLKENVVTLSDAITRLKTLSPKRFNFKSAPSITLDGFLAHEVTAVPEAVEGEKDGVITQEMLDAGTLEGTVGDPIYQGIDHSKLVPLLVAAVQELTAKVEVLETEVAALKAA